MVCLFSDFSVGSDGTNGDVCAEEQVGFGDYDGSASVSSSGVEMVVGNYTNTTSSRRRKRSAGGQFLMEPGR